MKPRANQLGQGRQEDMKGNILFLSSLMKLDERSGIINMKLNFDTAIGIVFE